MAILDSIIGLKEARQRCGRPTGAGTPCRIVLSNDGLCSRHDIHEIRLKKGKIPRSCQYCQRSFCQERGHPDFCSQVCEKKFRAIQRGLEGYVYILVGGDCRTYYKIGRSKYPPARLYIVSTQLPFRVELLHLIKSDNAAKAEFFLHRRFADKRLNGEWFALDPEDVYYICNLTGYVNGEFGCRLIIQLEPIGEGES